MQLKLNTYLLLLVVILLSACNKSESACDEVSGDIPVRIDFQSGFDRDQVKLYLNNCRSFSGELTTSDVLSLAKIHRTSLAQQDLDIQVFKNGYLALKQNVQITDTVYFNISIDHQTGLLEMGSSKGPFAYD